MPSIKLTRDNIVVDGVNKIEQGQKLEGVELINMDEHPDTDLDHMTVMNGSTVVIYRLERVVLFEKSKQ